VVCNCYLSDKKKIPMGATLTKIKTFLCFHITCFVIGTIVFVLSFRIPLFTHTVFFYRGIILLALVSMCMGFVLLYIKLRRIQAYDLRDILLCVVMFFCINLVVFTHLPVTADRSISIFLLGYMNAHKNENITREELHAAFIDTYVEKHNALEKRINEQLQSGTITQVGSGYQITGFGKWLMQVYTRVASLFGIQKNNISM
jgi:Ca2+/Na+ antiporter